tara:strand:+ start:3075 stop:4697 length:1623 start_codon:yes stop_codon:yes gene_type:complete
MRRPTAAQLRGARPVFVLRVVWAGRLFTFADRPCTISSDDGTISCHGSLDLRGYADALGEAGAVQQGGTASLAVEFPRLDVVDEYLKARPLEGALCELSMVFAKGATIITAWEDRLPQLYGTASRPQAGFPGRPAGYAAFTITARPFDDETPILRPEWKISSATQANANLSSTDGVGGAAYPWVFGSPGDAGIPGVPAYLTNTTPGSRELLIGVGKVQAEFVTPWDDAGVSASGRTVSQRADGLGTIASYADLVSIGGGFNVSGGKHYVSYHSTVNRYGVLSPFRRGPLTEAGDLIRYLYGLTAFEVDHPAWIAAAPVLDRYRFGGYVNDPTTSVARFVRDQLLPRLPVTLRIGPDGLYPISLLPLVPLAHLPQVTVSPTQGIEQTSPVQITRQLSDVVNQVALSYYYNARDGRLVSQAIASTDPDLSTRTPYAEAQRSAEIYGVRSGAEVKASYVTEQETADELLRWLLHDRGFLHMAVQVQAQPRWGWLMVGDQISLTAADISLTGRRATVTQKLWDGSTSTWRYTLAWSLSPVEYGL